jgi:glutamate racemase
MAEGPVGFVDSGIGGLPYLAFTRRMLPGERYVYAADRENFPYGEKTPKEITDAVTALTARLVEREHPRLVVVACNTASVVSLAELRARFPVPFVGVVPAVKPAASLSRRKSVGVLATQRTVEGEYLRDLIERHAGGCRVESFPAGDLVSFVEREMHRCGPEERAERVRREARGFRDAGLDTVVLACTHFLHLEVEFRAELGAGVEIVDSRGGVARQIARLLAEGRGGSGGQGGAGRPAGRDTLYVTGSLPVEDRYAFFAESFGLALGGIL